VIAGDVDLPAGKFDGATALLAAMAELGHGIDQVGISGYPESHPFISDETTIQVTSISSLCSPLSTRRRRSRIRRTGRLNGVKTLVRDWDWVREPM
jgi:hypothetical protein